MSHIELYGRNQGSALPTRAERALGRALAHVRVDQTVALAKIDTAVQRRDAAADGVTAVAGRAMHHVTMVSQAEQTLAQAVPHASGRLAAIADIHAVAMTAIVMDTARALERLV